jgi:hypothetical protein
VVMRVNVGETIGLYSFGSDVRFRFGVLKRRSGVSIAKCYAAAVRERKHEPAEIYLSDSIFNLRDLLIFHYVTDTGQAKR